MTKKVVLKVEVHDEKDKQKAMKAVSGLSGIESLAMDMKDKKLTIVGDVDPVEVVGKLKRSWHTEILTVGPAKQPENKKADEAKNDVKKDEQIAELLKLYNNHHYPYYRQNYHVYSTEENPNSCTIC